MDNCKIRMAMVGGGEGAFIGAVHRIAARLDGQIELVAGAFSSDPQKSITMGKQLGLAPTRCYDDYHMLLQSEAALPESERIHFVAIVTPNHLHFPIAAKAIEYGFHVLSDKPATLNLSEALQLQTLLQQTNCLYGLTHTYTGYPMVKEARHRIATGELGNIRKVVVEYSQGWLASEDDEQSKQASWRLDASQSGISCCMGDIGVHAANLTEYVSGLTITSLCADLNTVVCGRQLDDDGTVLLRFDNGAKGVLLASQIALGEENNLTLKIYGDKASIEWSQMEPNSLWLRMKDAPAQLLRTGTGTLCHAATNATRVPAGHPEGYLEAFANIYLNFAMLIQARQQQPDVQPEDFDVPSIQAAVRGMAFIENAVAASAKETKWHPFNIG
ncbi:Gfo/Idh/MocA family oxidoreductase [Pseudoalteromonas sp. SCSIO 43201]|uniref:Gfo/Idh/MocA family protein n=1 Tax=Pseudoalteromonas sp. SCSIO 43201 TaxID=2822842 RepID=UPI0020763747|nr:Gfo/Idh/MocA family oxidoreductase [Pseudoalteromonas sp. SCSIO 43201]USD27530.1 Gfo/Idh/MocA family oxidoreductase [Pseudoalteromonas sp. SCSIO 43201]